MTKRKKGKSGKRRLQTSAASEAAFRLHRRSGFYVVDLPTNSPQIAGQRIKEIEAEMDLEMIRKHTSVRPD